MCDEKIIELNKGLIYKIAKRFYNASLEDLYQAGRLGVVKAYKKYKTSGTTKFSTYAYDFIFGEMYACVNKESQIKVSRDILRLYNLVEKTRYSLAQKKGYIPTNKEIALFLKEDVNKIEQAIQAANALVCKSLDYQENDDERSIYESIAAPENISLDERLTLQEGLNNLNEDERKILEYRYFEDLTQSEVARKLKMTQVKVSRYEKKGIDKMRLYYNTSCINKKYSYCNEYKDAA